MEGRCGRVGRRVMSRWLELGKSRWVREEISRWDSGLGDVGIEGGRWYG